MTVINPANQSLRRAGLIAGVALLTLAALAGYATIGIIGALVTNGDAAKTAHDILASHALFRIGVGSLVLGAVLDVIIAWALQIFFKPVHKNISTLAAIFRVTYAAIYVVAISQLSAAVNLLTNLEYAKAYSVSQVHAEMLQKIDSFDTIWQTGLIFFGIHLLLIGYLAYRSTYVPKLVGILLIIAGLGYLVDSFGTIIITGYSADVGKFTFVGEAVLFIWLLLKGRKVTLTI